MFKFKATFDEKSFMQKKVLKSRKLFLTFNTARKIFSDNSGMSLVLVIIIAGAIMFFGFTFVELFRTNLHLSNHAMEKISAKTAASAGIDEAFYELKRDSVWQNGFSFRALSHSGARYSLTFNTIQNAIPYSTNNVVGVVSVKGYGGRLVPPGMVHLISVGESYGVKAKEEAVVSPAGAIVVRSRW